MKNYTIKERQEIYEHLLTLDCPDLLAALIAQRADNDFMCCEANKFTTLRGLIENAFIWDETPEGQSFWQEIDIELSEMILYRASTLSDVIESTEQEMFDSVMKVHNMGFESPTEGGTLILTSPSKIEFKGESTVFEEEMQKLQEQFNKGIPSLSFWTKVKLFFGRWGYKV